MVTYAVEVTQNGCTAISNCYQINNLMSVSLSALNPIYCNGNTTDVKLLLLEELLHIPIHGPMAFQVQM